MKSRKLRRCALIVALSTTLVGAIATPAHAFFFTWQLTDGFEGNPQANWSFSGIGGGFRAGGFDTSPGSPRTGSQLAWLDMNGDGWYSVSRTVHLTPAASRTTTCQAQVYLISSQWSPVNLEIIDPRSWTYVAFRQVAPTGVWPYQLFSIGSWVTGPSGAVDVVVRITLLGDNRHERVMADDLSILCVY